MIGNAITAGTPRRAAIVTLGHAVRAEVMILTVCASLQRLKSSPGPALACEVAGRRLG